MGHLSQFAISFVLVASCFNSLCEAGLRGPDKYCGVVVFDRWS